MCATVCPSQALAYVPPEAIARQRREKPDQRLPVRQPDGDDQGLHDGARRTPDAIARRRRRLHVGGRAMSLIRRPSDDRRSGGTSSRSTPADERYVNRRQFAKFLVLTSLGMFVGNALDPGRGRCSREPSPLPAAAWSRARPAICPWAACALFHYPGAERSLHPASGRAPRRYVAYSQKCTHLSLRGLLRRRERRGSSARATRATSPSRTAACCRARRRGRCRASASSGGATSWWRRASKRAAPPSSRARKRPRVPGHEPDVDRSPPLARTR